MEDWKKKISSSFKQICSNMLLSTTINFDKNTPGKGISYISRSCIGIQERGVCIEIKKSKF